MPDFLSNPLLALIKEQGLIDDLQLEEVTQEQGRSGKSIAQILHDFGIVEMETQLQIVATHLGTEVVDLSERELGPELVHLLPRTVARTHVAVPVADYGSSVQIALQNPLNPSTV